ncbi:ShlB/FhaC/HecB family hemolysin secretion/activation protein [Polaromonas sp.]|uniref:ShlB/FhaC/HecB family hemolysin secretion/activation protein n=1 Tax=Polaromonas sp. TaxID=1869339 RepID=UPI0032636044
MVHHKFPLSTLSSALVLALCGVSSAIWAQTPGTPAAPDAGQVLRDLQQAPGLAPAPVPPLQRIEESTDPSQDPQGKVLVKSVVITGNQEIPTAQLQPLVASLVGTERSLAQLSAAARRLTAHYRAQGFAVARAYLPAQDITDGVITIAIIEGRIARHKINNQARLSNDRASAYFGSVKDGDVIRAEQIDRGLLILQDTPGVASSRATLQPGASVGTSELLIDVLGAPAYNGNATLDNHGSRYTGEYRAGANLNLASPLKIGDQLSFGALTSGSQLTFGRIAYQLPVGSDGWRIGAAYFGVHYKLGKEFEALQAHGTASSTSIFASYPFIRSQLANLYGTLSHEEKRLDDQVEATLTRTAKHVGVSSLGLSGKLQDTLGGGGISNAELTLAMGSLQINSPSALAIDAASAQTSGGYSKVAYSASRLQRLTNESLLFFSVTGQQASKNLDSSEKFSLGGPSGVRAYPTAEAGGDEGYRATLELRHSFTPQWQGALFYDMGEVKINKRPFGAPGNPNKRALAGAGVGLNANIAAVQLKASLAWRTHGGQPTSIPASSVKSPTLWVQAVVAF